MLITVPSHFTPIYLKAAVDAGKHVFCEKTHAVDAPGMHSVIESGRIARERGLSIVSGLAWRYPYRRDRDDEAGSRWGDR